MSETAAATCQECGEPGHSYTLHGHTVFWHPGVPDRSPGVNWSTAGPAPSFVRYCGAHALAKLGCADANG